MSIGPLWASPSHGKENNQSYKDWNKSDHAKNRINVRLKILVCKKKKKKYVQCVLWFQTWRLHRRMVPLLEYKLSMFTQKLFLEPQHKLGCATFCRFCDAGSQLLFNCVHISALMQYRIHVDILTFTRPICTKITGNTYQSIPNHSRKFELNQISGSVEFDVDLDVVVLNNNSLFRLNFLSTNLHQNHRKYLSTNFQSLT